MACQTRVTDAKEHLSHSALPWLERRPWPHRGDLGVPWYYRKLKPKSHPAGRGVKHDEPMAPANAAFSSNRMIDPLTACAIIFLTS